MKKTNHKSIKNESLFENKGKSGNKLNSHQVYAPNYYHNKEIGYIFSELRKRWNIQ